MISQLVALFHSHFLLYYIKVDHFSQFLRLQVVIDAFFKSNHIAQSDEIDSRAPLLDDCQFEETKIFLKDLDTKRLHSKQNTLDKNFWNKISNKITKFPYKVFI